MDGLTYLNDKRDTDPNHNEYRKARFQEGWRKALDKEKFADATLKDLTWENLGYRLGVLFGETDKSLIEDMYAWCVEQQRRAK